MLGDFFEITGQHRDRLIIDPDGYRIEACYGPAET
jgi:hypothetical protein